MEKMMAIVFEDKNKALQGIDVLRSLDADGTILLHGGSLIRMQKTGPVIVQESGLEDFPVGMLTEDLLGALMRLLVGITNLVANTAISPTPEVLGDMAVGTADDELVNELYSLLRPGNHALLLDVTEDRVMPIDGSLMRDANVIIRRPKIDVEYELIAKRIESEQEAMNELGREWEQQRVEQIRFRMEDVRNRNRRRIEREKQRRERLQKWHEVTRNDIWNSVADANADAKLKLKNRIEKLDQRNRESLSRIDHTLAELQRADTEFTKQTERAAGGRLEPKKAA